MKILAISSTDNKNNICINKSSKNTNSRDNTVNFELSNSIKNYVVPFMGNNKRKVHLPNELRQSTINECNPVPDDGVDSERLSGILSTAFEYLKNDNLVVLGCSDRRDMQNKVRKIFYDDNIFSEEREINNVIVIEDDRIIDEPITFIKEGKKLYVIGNAQIVNKETKEKIYATDTEKTLINPYIHSIKLYNTDLDNISLGEIPDRRDLQHIKKFKVEDFLDLDFRTSGNLSPEEFSTRIDKEAQYVAGKHPLFSDIGGNKEAIQRIVETIFAPMVYPDLFGHVMTKGTLLAGPPGTGKSMLGIALANELSKRLGQKVSIHEISGAQMQISAVGGSEAKWRALFETAIENQPSIILIDEVDACTPKRDDSSNARFDNSVVNQLLSLFSNLEKSDNKVYVIGMTNRPEAIDPAMLRPGRLGNLIPVPAPNFEEAKDIFYKVSNQYKFDDTFDVDAFLKKIISVNGTGSIIAGTLENAQLFARRKVGIYQRVLDNTLTKENFDDCLISQDDIDKAFACEIEKQKKAKISSDRIVIKGFRN